MESDKSPQETRRARMGVTAFGLVALLLVLPTGHGIVDLHTFDLQDHAEEYYSPFTVSYCWRGYTFTVNEPVLVTALHGGYENYGSGEGKWHVGLYAAPSLEMNGEPAEMLLASGELTADERFQRVDVPPVPLLPGEAYLLAQGREDGQGRDYRVSEIDTLSIVASEPHIDAWGPADGRAFTFSCTGGPEHPVETPASRFTSTIRPHVGFESLLLDA